MMEWWADPEAPWWAKLRRARIHISEVQQLADALQDAGAWSVQREPAGADGWAYRFRLHRAIPADLAAAAGDAAANMRSALDHVAYELARRHAGDLDGPQEAATAFPICVDEAEFREFFTKGRRGVRSGLYGDAERRALQCVQPFALRDEARAIGVEWPAEPADELLADHAYALNALWNIDKHRRLPGLAWARSGPAWWSGAGDEDAAFSVHGWAEHVRELAPLQDDTLFYELRGLPGTGRPQVELHQEIDLVLTDDPSPYGSPLVARLEGLHQALTGWVVPRVFIVAGGRPPPIAISFAAPA
jgi:hypothetical protein